MIQLIVIKLVFSLCLFPMVEISFKQHVFLYTKDVSFVVLAFPSDDGQ
jgi:hypothetical protein